MKKVVITARRSGQIVNAVRPRAVADWAIVKVMTAPLCTEYRRWEAGVPSETLGHEAVGEVVEATDESPVRPGQRVLVTPQSGCGCCSLCLQGEHIYCLNNRDFCKTFGTPDGAGTLAQFLAKPSWLLQPIPDSLSYDHASLACCGLGPTFGALRQVGTAAGETVLITGLGPVGLGGVIVARWMGCRVIAVERNPWRVRRALDLGAEAVYDPDDFEVLRKILSHTESSQGIDHAIDCSGSPHGHRICLEATRRRGIVSFVGESGDESTPLYISPDLIRKGLTLHGSWHYSLQDLPLLFQIICNSGPSLELLISHRLPLSEVQKAWEIQAEGCSAKVLLKPWE